MELRRVSDLDAFCRVAEPKLGVFGSRKWLEVYGDRLQVIGIYRDGQQLSGGFYFIETRKMGLKMLKLPPYTPHCGFFFESTASNKSSQSNNMQEVMTELSVFLEARRATILVLAFPPGITALQRFTWNHFKVIPSYTYRIALNTPLEQIREHFDPKHRNAIAKAGRDGVMVKEGNDPESTFAFFRRSLAAAGANVYEKELKKILFGFSDSSNAFTLTAEKSGARVGMVHCVFDKEICYYLLGGVEKTSGLQGINHLLVSEAIAKAKSLGCGTFDFEGSILPGVEKFFRGFGPELFPYFTINKANLFTEILLKFYKRSIF
jgi:lipid II:glycine glycyltransferase (peptidoglycan interpeptide bridge formation enzyme)